jgi:hypothetical protein
LVGRTLFFKALLVVLVKDVPGLLAALNSTDECSPGPFHGDVFFFYMKIHALSDQYFQFNSMLLRIRLFWESLKCWFVKTIDFKSNSKKETTK